jgi:hypothetical protein
VVVVEIQVRNLLALSLPRRPPSLIGSPASSPSFPYTLFILSPFTAGFLGFDASNLSGPPISAPRSGDAGGRAIAVDSEGYFFTVESKRLQIFNPQYFPKSVDCSLVLRPATPESVHAIEVTIRQGGKPMQSIKFTLGGSGM